MTHKKYGTTVGYLAARIASDRPDIAARLKAGEFPSVHAAALAAEVIRPMGQYYLDNPADAARCIRRHFRGERLNTLIRELQGHNA